MIAVEDQCTKTGQERCDLALELVDDRREIAKAIDDEFAGNADFEIVDLVVKSLDGHRNLLAMELECPVDTLGTFENIGIHLTQVIPTCSMWGWKIIQ